MHAEYIGIKTKYGGIMWKKLKELMVIFCDKHLIVVVKFKLLKGDTAVTVLQLQGLCWGGFKDSFKNLNRIGFGCGSKNLFWERFST